MDARDDSCEPMDVDLSLSTHSNKSTMNISHSDDYDADTKSNINILPTINTSSIPNTSDEKPTNHSMVKKYHINISKKKKKILFYNILYILLMVCTSVLTFYVMNFKCSGVDLENIKNILSEKVHGQSKAINTIIQTLDIKTSSKILFLYGGTGVGKTYTTSLILEDTWNCSNVYHYTMPSFTTKFAEEFMLSLPFCKTSIFVVDDLSRGDNITLQIKDVIKRSEWFRNNITVILVYNCENVSADLVKHCDPAFDKYLKETFKSINTLKQIIKFEPLTEEHLLKCIQNEIGTKVLSKLQMDRIIKNFNVSLDGCKGVYNRMKLFINSMKI